MWTRLNAPLDGALVDSITGYFSSLEGVYEDRHFLSAGKKFFRKEKGFGHLQAIVRHLDRELPLSRKWAEPAIQHTFPLYKSPRGPATSLHQDRAYWLPLETVSTMMSFWIALEDISEDMGCLKLTPLDRVEPSDFMKLNTPAELYPHQPDGDRHILGEVAEKLAASMVTVPVRKGEILLFDSFQVHGASPNRTDRTRRAMKVVIGDARSVSRYLITLKDLENFKPSPQKKAPLLKRLKNIFS